MVVIKNKPKQQQQQHLLDADQQEKTTQTHHFQKSRAEPPPAVVVPQRFERVLNNLTVDLDYPGYALDVSATREAIVSDSKSKMLRLFRQMKEKQRVYDEYYNRNKNVSSSKKEIETLELVQRRPERSDQKEKRDVSEDYDNYDNTTTKKEEVRDNIEEDPRDDKEDIYAAEDCRSHSNLVHSLQVKQDRHVVGDRSHWRLQKLDDLRVDLTYPEWEIDLAHVEDWHRHHSDTRENTIRFHEIIEGMLHQQYIYLSWKDYDHDHNQEQEPQIPQNPFPDVDQIAAPIVHYNRGSSDSDSDDTQEVVEEMKQSSLDNKSEKKKTDKSIVADRKNKSKVSLEQNRSHSKKYSLDSNSSSYMTVGALCAAHRRRLASSKSSSMNEERRESSETEKKNQYCRSITSSSSVSSRRQKEASDHTSLSPQVTEEELGHCDMCTIRVKTHVLVPCGHLGCAACSHHAWRKRTRCPTCQQTVNKVVRIESS